MFISYKKVNYFEKLYNTFEAKVLWDLKKKSSKKDVGTLFKEAREKAELTQAEVAKKAGIDPNYYARIERAGKRVQWPEVMSSMTLPKH